MNLFLMIFINLAISFYLASRNKQKRTSISPLAIDNSGVPIADETSNYQLSYGTVENTQSNCTWYGDTDNFPIYTKTKSDSFLSFLSTTTKTQVANGYSLGMIMSLGYGQQNLKAIKVEDKYLFRSTNVGSYEAYVDNKTFFGAYEQEGGMAGKFRFYAGNDDQPSDPYFARIVNRVVPNYPNKAYIIFESFYIGNTNSVPNMSYVTERFPHYSFLDSSKVNINNSCNPINIISDVLLSPICGANIDINKIDTESFFNAQAKLYEEQFGLSFNKYDDTACSDIINSTNQIIDANIRIRRDNGKLKIKLNRQDYKLDDLYVLNEDNIITSKKYSTNATDECVTEYKLTYTDINDDFKQKMITFHNEGKYSENNQIVSKTEDYLAITDVDIARRVALRNALPLTQQFITMTLSLNDIDDDLDVGDVVAVSLEKNKIKKMPMRIAEIDWGTAEDTTINVTLQQDLFSPVLYTTSKNNNYWKDTDYTATNVDLVLVEAPFAFTSNASSAVDRAEVLGMAKKDNSALISYVMYNQNNEIISNASSFCPTTKLYSAIGKLDEMIVLTNDSTLSVIQDDTETNVRKGYNIAMITENNKVEFVGFTKITSNILSNVKRGLLDTIPQSFTSNADIRFFTYGMAQTSNSSYSNGSTAQLKAQTKTSRQELDVNSATLKSLSIIGRAAKPILPNNLKINNQNFNDNITIGLTDKINVTYSFRNKQKEYVQFYSEIDNNNADNNEYVLSFYDQSTGNLIKEVVTSENNYLFDDEATLNNNNLFNSVKLEIKARKNSIESLFKYTIIINRT